jgi:hypothetical protein
VRRFLVLFFLPPLAPPATQLPAAAPGDPATCRVLLVGGSGPTKSSGCVRGFGGGGADKRASSNG